MEYPLDGIIGNSGSIVDDADVHFVVVGFQHDIDATAGVAAGVVEEVPQDFSHGVAVSVWLLREGSFGLEANLELRGLGLGHVDLGAAQGEKVHTAGGKD